MNLDDPTRQSTPSFTSPSSTTSSESDERPPSVITSVGLRETPDDSPQSTSGWSFVDPPSIATRSHDPTPTDPIMVVIGGVDVDVAVTARTTTNMAVPLFPMADRDKLQTEGKLADLFERATKGQGWKFELISQSLDDLGKLKDTYDLKVMINRLRESLIKYDIHGVFDIVHPSGDVTSDPTIAPTTINLFTDYSDLTLDQVATSNRWFNTWTEQVWFSQNLNLSYQFLSRHMSRDLFDKCAETYSTYELDQQGGPLLFKIMLMKLQSDSDAAMDYLKSTVQNMKLTLFDGENVSTAVSLLRGAEDRFRANNPSRQVPDDFHKWVIAVLQTSSVPSFNAIFEQMVRTARIASATTGTKIEYPKSSVTLPLAETTYLSMLGTDDWAGITTKGGDKSSFKSSVGSSPNSNGNRDKTCFNCGETGHMVPDCPKTRNDDAVARRAAEYKAKKSQQPSSTASSNKSRSQPTTGKFAPPTRTENGRRVIDGKPMHYHYKWKRWLPDRPGHSNTPTSSPAGGHVATTTPAMATPAPVAPPNPTTVAAVASLKQSLITAFDAFQQTGSE